MIKSMTGFGKAEAKTKSGRFTVEIRTVNHRYFDLSSKLPNGLVSLEDRIKDYLRKYIKRGKANLFLSHHAGEKNYSSITFDEKAIAKYYRILNGIRKKFKVKDDIKLSHILSFSDVIIQEEREFDSDSLWKDIEAVLKNAVVDCNRMREREGRALYKDLTARINKISGYLEKILVLAPEVVQEYKKKLDSRINEIVRNKDIDEARLETELAIFAKQCDISEELTRSRSHLDGLAKVLDSGEEAGRKIDFILQELNREINTLGAKANDIRIARIVIDVKSELEKMREQAQNIE